MTLPMATMVEDTHQEAKEVIMVMMVHHPQGALMNASSVDDLDTGHVNALQLGEVVAVDSLLVPSLVEVVAEGIDLVDQIA